jgi:hypothetical protein
MLQECGVVGDWHKYPTWAWHTVGAEIRALLLIHYVTYAQELDSFLKVLIGISVAFHLMLFLLLLLFLLRHCDHGKGRSSGK